MKLFTNFIATLLIHQTLVVVGNGLTTGASLEHAELANIPNLFKKNRKKKLSKIQQVPVVYGQPPPQHNIKGTNFPSADALIIGSGKPSNNYNTIEQPITILI